MRPGPTYRGTTPLWAALLLALCCACGAGAELGETCGRHQDCASEYQCLRDRCSPRCELHADCGDGFVCTGGMCEAVASAIGDVCARELDCGPAQTCQLDGADVDGDNMLAATCQSQSPGGNVGAVCESDGECRSNLCTLGQCSELCTTNSDCPSGSSCAIIPRLLASSAPLFHGCLPSTGVLLTPVPVRGVSDTLRIPVPSNAQSFALVLSTQDQGHRVGATSVISPSGRTLYLPVLRPEDVAANLIRYSPQPGVSTLFIPNTDRVDLETGVYQVGVASSLPGLGTGVEIPTATLLYKLDTSRVLDLHFYFLNLADHPCADAQGETLRADTAPSSESFQKQYLTPLRQTLSEAGLKSGITTYTDVHRADLDSIDRTKMRELLSLADHDSGIAVFIVRSLVPDGLQALPGGVPGPPRTPHTPASGIVISLDTACFRPWETVARVTAHAIGAQMGLFANRDQDGLGDPISDSDVSVDNLMFFGEFGGSELSEGQRHVLGRYPGLR